MQAGDSTALCTEQAVCFINKSLAHSNTCSFSRAPYVPSVVCLSVLITGSSPIQLPAALLCSGTRLKWSQFWFVRRKSQLESRPRYRLSWVTFPSVPPGEEIKRCPCPRHEGT